MTLTEVWNNENQDIHRGTKGWTKAKCLKDECNTITLWNSKVNKVKCADGKCAACGGAVKRTVWSRSHNYVIMEGK